MTNITEAAHLVMPVMGAICSVLAIAIIGILYYVSLKRTL